jgi:hypothetical protein
MNGTGEFGMKLRSRWYWEIDGDNKEMGNEETKSRLNIEA